MPHDAFRGHDEDGHAGGIRRRAGAASARRRCNPTVLTTVVAGPSGPIAVSESWAPVARIWRPAHAATPATLSPTWPRSAPRSTRRCTTWVAGRSTSRVTSLPVRAVTDHATRRSGSPGTYSRSWWNEAVPFDTSRVGPSRSRSRPEGSIERGWRRGRTDTVHVPPILRERE